MIHSSNLPSVKNDAKNVRRCDLKARARASKRFLVPIDSTSATAKPAIFRIVIHPAVQDAARIMNKHSEHMRSIEQMRETFLQQSEEFNID